MAPATFFTNLKQGKMFEKTREHVSRVKRTKDTEDEKVIQVMLSERHIVEMAEEFIESEVHDKFDFFLRELKEDDFLHLLLIIQSFAEQEREDLSKMCGSYLTGLMLVLNLPCNLMRVKQEEPRFYSDACFEACGTFILDEDLEEIHSKCHNITDEFIAITVSADISYHRINMN